MDISFFKIKGEIAWIGASFENSHTYIQFLTFLKIGFKVSYRTVQGSQEDYLIIKVEEIHFNRLGQKF